MKRLDKIRQHKVYQQCMTQILEAEKDRIYCRHGMDHALDVARIAYILCLERGLPIERELIYAMALLHDLGRSKEYTEGTPHHQAGEALAREILEDCDFQPEEIAQICMAIRGHSRGNQEQALREPLREILYQADKVSRPCYSCMARKTCYWSENEKNMQIKY